MSHDRPSPRLTPDLLAWLVSRSRSLHRDMEGTNEGQRWQALHIWARSMLDLLEETKPNGEEGKP